VTSLEELEARVAALEQRLATQTQVWTEADTDLGSLAAHVRSQTTLIQALALTQTEHTRLLEQHGRALAGHTATLDLHTRALSGIESLLEKILRRLPDPGEGS